MNIAILQYNNYFNKVIKKAGDTADDYFAAAHQYQTFPQNLNLKPNDEIMTSIVLDAILFHPDYLIQYDDTGNILSRWFVLEIVQNRGKQHTLTIRRDVITDNIAAVRTAKGIVERGTLLGDSPLLMNPENFSFNQIKKGEVLLKDESGVPWIVGYLASNYSDESYIEASTETARSYETVESLGLVFKDNSDPSKGAEMDVLGDAFTLPTFCTAAFFGTYQGVGIKTRLDYPNWTSVTSPDYGSTTLEKWSVGRPWDNRYSEENERLAFLSYSQAVAGNGSAIRSEIISAYNYASESQRSKLISLNGQVVYSTVTQKYYHLWISGQSAEQDKVREASTDSYAPLFERLRSLVQYMVASSRNSLNWLDPSVYYVMVNHTRIFVTLTEVAAEGQIRTKIPNARNKLIDGPYDMFAMPFTIDNLALAQQIKVALDKNVYDIQILPYCPYREFIDDFSGGTEDSDYVPIEQYDADLDEWNTVGYMLFPLSCSASFIIGDPIASDAFMDESIDDGPIRSKIMNETQHFRLCSPNYGSAFDFSVMKNGGSVDSWRVDFTYRPVSPYVHVAPTFSGIYGMFNDDARGLILLGDFSIDAVSNEWISYQIQNKNYMNIFNTQIKTMDQLHELEQLQKGLTTGAGSVVTGVMAGAKTGNAAIGVGTAALTATAGIFDIAMNQERFNVNRRQAIEMFSYQLGNIKALPNTLTKVSAYNVNNKYFPLIEVYGASSQEIKAFKDFLELRGFTIGACGTLFDYVQYTTMQRPFLKARIIRMDDFRGDSHMAEEIYKEIEEGVYLDEIN